jgi:hypothetical protein
MCRYSDHNYKSSHVCFDCRLSFQRPYQTEQTCPKCKRPMVDLGRDFKAPRRRDKRAWSRLPRRPYSFNSCGCNGGYGRRNLLRRRRRVWRYQS